MRTLRVTIFCFVSILLLSTCCTRRSCNFNSITYPNITLYFPEAYEPLHTLTQIRLRKGTNTPVDTFSETCGDKECPFTPWVFNANTEWSNWDYVLYLDEPTYSDTVYGITYNKVMNTVVCNDCIGPFSQSRSYDTGRYTNLSYYHKGKSLHEGDTILMLKR